VIGVDTSDEDLPARVRRAVQEEVAIVPYDPAWPQAFAAEKQHLLTCLPADMINRIEHFGSTAVPGLAAKPIIDMLIEVRSLPATRGQIVPILQVQGYDYFWRPTQGDDIGPFYAFFIKRNSCGIRTHHIHMVERDFPQWSALLFRDYVIAHPEVAVEYQELKMNLASAHPNDRVAYTEGKSEFVMRITETAKAQGPVQD
jgi:GrpB-like predicted nucleotidyltransferase (UPF0157 family)